MSTINTFICPCYQVACVNGDNKKVKLFAGQATISLPITKTENQATINPIVNQLCPLYNLINGGGGIMTINFSLKLPTRPAGQRLSPSLTHTHTLSHSLYVYTSQIFFFYKITFFPTLHSLRD